MSLAARGERSRPSGTLATLHAHGVYLSEADEAVLIRRVAVTDDVGELLASDLPVRVRVDGFDAYWEHLREVFSKAP